MTKNPYGLLKNQYLIIETSEEKPLPPYKWDGDKFVEVRYREFTSLTFGKIKPKNSDPYQIAYMDSINNNQFTIATGPAGSGKTLMALAYAMQGLEKGTISRLYLFTNPWIAHGASKLRKLSI